LATVSGLDAIEDSIKAILTSLQGSHILESWLGVPSILFRPIRDLAAIEEVMREALIDGDDRLDPDRTTVSIPNDPANFDSGYLPIRVDWAPLGEATERSLEFGFRLPI
jgi:hypothetical protein